jgi:hypothetical protein
MKKADEFHDTHDTQFFVRPAEIFLVGDMWKWGTILFVSSMFLWCAHSPSDHAMLRALQDRTMNVLTYIILYIYILYAL